MGWLSVNQMACKNIVTDAWKILKNGPEYIKKQLLETSPVKTTRSTNRGDFKKQNPGPSFLSQASQVWNSELFQDIRDVEKISQVKSDIKKAVAPIPV